MALFLVVGSSTLEAKDRVYPQSEEELSKAYDQLNWQIEAKQYQLVKSNGSFQLSEGFGILLGDEAEQFLFLNNGTEFSDIDAVVLKGETGEELIFSFFETGYIKDDDWSNLDADALLEGVKEGTEEANAERSRNNVSKVHVIGWVQRPTYDEAMNTAYWAIRAKDEDGEEVINAIALKLGRKGFNKVTWVGSPEEFQPQSGLLMEALNDFHYDTGFKYADFSTSDKVAAVGLASLVAVTAGSKGGKGVALGAFAVALAFAKKLWFLIVLPFVGAWKWLKRKFTNHDNNSQ